MEVLDKSDRAGPLHRWILLTAASAALVCCFGCWEQVDSELPPQIAERPEQPPIKTVRRDSKAAPNKSGRAEPTEPTAEELFGEGAIGRDLVIVQPSIGVDPYAAAVEPSDSSFDEALSPSSVTPQLRLDAWRIASAWSLAAAAASKGVEAERYASYLAEADRSATALGIQLPPLPASEPSDDLQAATVRALRTGVGADLVARIADRTDAAGGAAAQLAIDAHLLLLTYSPLDFDGKAAASAMRSTGQRAQLPTEIWQPLADLLDRGADFVSVRSAVFDLHKSVAEHLAARSDPAGGDG
jgi:hypothetical protein